jgi:hypothetical protein
MRSLPALARAVTPLLPAASRAQDDVEEAFRLASEQATANLLAARAARGEDAASAAGPASAAALAALAEAGLEEEMDDEELAALQAQLEGAELSDGDGDGGAAGGADSDEEDDEEEEE